MLLKGVNEGTFCYAVYVSKCAHSIDLLCCSTFIMPSVLNLNQDYTRFLIRIWLTSLRPSDAYIWVIKLGHHWFRWWLVAWPAPSHYLKQYWNNVNWTTRNKFQWNFNQNTTIFIKENAFENVVCKVSTIFTRPQCLKTIDGIPNQHITKHELSAQSILQ